MYHCDQGIKYTVYFTNLSAASHCTSSSSQDYKRRILGALGGGHIDMNLLYMMTARQEQL